MNSDNYLKTIELASDVPLADVQLKQVLDLEAVQVSDVQSPLQYSCRFT